MFFFEGGSKIVILGVFFVGWGGGSYSFMELILALIIGLAVYMNYLFYSFFVSWGLLLLWRVE